MNDNIKNWRPVGEMAGVYLPDERWEIRVLEAAITPRGVGRQWSVHLVFDGHLHETITTDLQTKEEADDEMITWVRSHPVVVSDRE